MKILKRYFEQRRIREGAPGILNWRTDKEKYLKLYLNLKVEKGKGVVIEYKTRQPLPDQPGQETDQLDFAIRNKFTVIEIYLEESKFWRWSTKLDGFTMKNRSRRIYYGALKYKRDEKSSRWTPAKKWIDSEGLYKECYCLQFKARRKGGKPDSHPFSLNIELKQPNGRWLPITIDPDVRNPPPTGSEGLLDDIKEKKNQKRKSKYYFFDSSIA